MIILEAQAASYSKTGKEYTDCELNVPKIEVMVLSDTFRFLIKGYEQETSQNITVAEFDLNKEQAAVLASILDALVDRI